MCGIVGYIGTKNASDIILHGLEKLEYRGYDSAGITIMESKGLTTVKRQGRLSTLEDAVNEHPLVGNVGIGHTRWATHGVPNEINAHPHCNEYGTISIVHNGIIENFTELKAQLLEEGVHFRSETDSEIIAHLISKNYHGDLLEAVKTTLPSLKGAYALGIVCSHEPNRLIAVRHESPLILALCEDGYIIASDIPSVIEYTKDVVYLDNDEVLDLNKTSYTVYNGQFHPVAKEVHRVEYSLDAASKEGFEHFLMKEIHEQPRAIKDAIARKLKDGRIFLGEGAFSKEEISSFQKIFITACGTAFHAGMVGKYALEQWAKRPVECEIASEYHYGDYFIDDKTLVILVSQSGETADTLAALKKSKAAGATTLAITNVVGSSIAREADKVIYCYAGPEISVASTKAYTTQAVCLYFLALDFAQKTATLDEEEISAIIKELQNIPSKIDTILDSKESYLQLAKDIQAAKTIFYTGRLLDYVTAREGALKLKEISYIHTEALPSGELKHGSLALIEPGTPVFSICTQQKIIEKTVSNNQELAARGADVYVLCMEGTENIEKGCRKVFYLPRTIDLLSPLLAVIPAQLIAYYTSYVLGNDVDKPRNLAKSVTVE